ncbi:MAG: 2-oxo acid dehydrogenase subunit E2 [Chloroflexi bacterium]|nr:MAG: 2-oxo acid dehydrogenase subunit E2 [Chloroflexota bacterium]
MADTVTMPKLGFDMQEGTLVRWVKVEGDSVNKGEILAEIETDKATVEVESSFSGVVARQLVNQGDVVPVGTAIAIIAAPGEKVEEAEKTQPENKPPEEAPAAEETGDLNPPTLGGGEQAAAETPGQAVEAPAAEQTEKERAEAAEKPVDEIPAATSEEDHGGDGRIKASPLARKIASENGLDLRKVKGSGPGGRIQRSDVETALRAPKPAPAQAQAPAPAPQAAPAQQAAPPAPAAPRAAPIPPAPVWAGAADVPQDEVIKVSRLRSAIGRRMVESKTQVPHFYVTYTYKFENLMDLRKQLNEYLPDDQKLTVNDFVIKAVALNLRQFPNLNASLRGDEVVRHGHINIGSAVSLEGGLMTVVVKDADQKPLRLISAEMRELVARARQGKVRPEDIDGSTFSISNMGMYDVDHFIAIINPPEAGILAIGSAQQVPVVEDGQVKIGMRMKATISVDHRVSDGAEGARFMQSLAAFLDEPMRLVL